MLSCRLSHQRPDFERSVLVNGKTAVDDLWSFAFLRLRLCKELDFAGFSRPLTRVRRRKASAAKTFPRSRGASTSEHLKGKRLSLLPPLLLAQQRRKVPKHFRSRKALQTTRGGLRACMHATEKHPSRLVVEREKASLPRDHASPSLLCVARTQEQVLNSYEAHLDAFDWLLSLAHFPALSAPLGL